MAVRGLLILCSVNLVAADLRMSSQPKRGFELVNQGTTKWNLTNYGQHMHFKYMEPSAFGYKGLEHQKRRNYDNFLRSNIDNEQDNRNFNDEDGKDHLPFRTYETKIDDNYRWHRHNRRIAQPPMNVQVSRVMNPGESMLVPLRWNNPHATEMEVNIWIFEHAGQHPVVVPIRKPSCSGEGMQDNVISFTVPNDFVSLGAKIPGFKGCNEDSKPQCVLQIYSHSVESRTYAIGFPIVIPGHKTPSSGEAVSEAIQKTTEDPWLELNDLRDICLPATDPSATITTSVPRWARLVSDVYNHAYQNSDYSPYSGQQHEGISKNLQASAINKMVVGNRGELGKAILPSETYHKLRSLQRLESKIYKTYEALANKVIGKLYTPMINTGTVGVGSKVQQLATCFRCKEVGSTNTKRLQTTTYIPSFQLPKDLVPQAKQIVGTKYAKLISDSGLVQIYVASLNDLLPFFYKARNLGIIYQAAVVKSTIGTMPDARNFKKRNEKNATDGGFNAASLALQKFASDRNCPSKCLYYKPQWKVEEALLQESDDSGMVAPMMEAVVETNTQKQSSISKPAKRVCYVRGYCRSGCNMRSRRHPVGPYSAGPDAWINTATCIDTLHVSAGCDFEVATGTKGGGQKYKFTSSTCMRGRGKPGYDRVRSIRVFPKVVTSFEAVGKASGEYCDEGSISTSKSTGKDDCMAKCKRVANGNCRYISLWTTGGANMCHLSTGCSKKSTQPGQTVQIYQKHQDGVATASLKISSAASKPICEVHGYCRSGCNMGSKRHPVGPYSAASGKWMDTATCIDTLHVSEGCAYEVATSTKGGGQRYDFTASACMARGGPGYDRVRSIRVFTKVENLARQQEEAEGPCIWRKVLNHYSGGWAGGVRTRFSLQGAQLRCLWLKEKCNAVTCNKDGKSCTVRASRALRGSRWKEISYVPGRACELDTTKVELPLIKDALATNTTGECQPCAQFFGKKVHPVKKPEVTPLAKDIMAHHTPKSMGKNNLKSNPDDQPHVGDIKMDKDPNSARRRRRSALIQKHE